MNLRKITHLNKKGADLPSMLYAVVSIFVIGVFLFFYVRLSGDIYNSFDEYFTNNPSYNGTIAHTTVEDIRDIEQSLMDYVFLIVVFGVVLSLFITAYATRISIAFFWIYGLMAFIIFITAVIASNIWQEMAAQDSFTTTLAAFPITNSILGNNYPLFILAVVLIGMILLFGKPSEGEIR